MPSHRRVRFSNLAAFLKVPICIWAFVSTFSSAMAHADETSLRVMTYNVKYASDSGDNTWGERRGILKASIEHEDPDVIGTQENTFRQIKDMEVDLPEYDWVGLGRAGGSRGEFMAIFYKKERFEVVAYDHFWLSDTPEVIGSRTWGHNNHRMVTWVRFRERATGAEFYHLNTHFDHRVQEAREKSAVLVMDRISKLDPPLPIVVTGDFNAAEDNVVHDTMTGEIGEGRRLADAWDTAKEHDGKQIGTIHGWRGVNNSTRRIDWILVSPEITVGRAKVVTFHEGTQYPSDHFAVLSDLVVTD